MGSKPGPQKLRKQCVGIVTQNMRGINHTKEEELASLQVQRGTRAACLQESWRVKRESWKNREFAFLTNSLAEKPCRRGAKGVAIALFPAARRAWEKGGEQRPCFGTRLLSTRLPSPAAR